jgi:hypothetical protein
MEMLEPIPKRGEGSLYFREFQLGSLLKAAPA